MVLGVLRPSAPPRLSPLVLSCLGVCYSSYKNLAAHQAHLLCPVADWKVTGCSWKNKFESLTIPHSCEVCSGAESHCMWQPQVNLGMLSGNCEQSQPTQSLNPNFPIFQPLFNQFYTSTMPNFKSSLSIWVLYICRVSCVSIVDIRHRYLCFFPLRYWHLCRID